MLFAKYSISDIPNFLRARTLAAGADASIDQSKFGDVIAKHRSEGYDSYKYFDKQLWLRSKMMRVIELGLDKSAPSSVLDMGCGAGYLYCCKYLGHSVHGLDLPDYEFYRDDHAVRNFPNWIRTTAPGPAASRQALRRHYRPSDLFQRTQDGKIMGR